MMTENSATLTKLSKNEVTETQDLPLEERLIMKALVFGGGKLASKAADAAVPGSGKLVDAIVSRLPELYKDHTDTTVITTLSRNTLIEETNENTITQSFHVRDTDHPMTVDLFYDTLFGTFAFIPRE